MPVYKKIQTENAEICLWLIKEGLDDFKMVDTQLESSHVERNIQWLASRAALLELGINPKSIEKDGYGKPLFKASDVHISLSHTKRYAAAVRANVEVGIDVEEITPRIEKIAKRFVHESEFAFIVENNRLETLYLLWAGKEALYKLYGKKAVDFKNHMIAKPFETKSEGWFQMEFLKDKPFLYAIQYEIVDNHVLVWVEA